MIDPPVPLDEFPVHQTPLSMAYVGASDRNFYDRSYFNAHDRTGDIFCVAGLGVYPNLGVTDAFFTVRRGDHQWVVRTSDALRGADIERLNPGVGPVHIEIIEPLSKIRVICDADDGAVADDDGGIGGAARTRPSTISCDLTFTGSFPAAMEQPHLMRTGPRAILDASRFAQVGTWEGTVRVDGEEIEVNPDRWVGTRDRSWGIRPSGESEPPGRAADEPLEGFWWTYVPLRFEDFALVLIVQEQPDGYRTLNDATRIWPDGRREQLGWPEIAITYESGTRHPMGARIGLRPTGGDPFEVEIDTLGFIALHVGAGYGGDPDWTHGQWRGRDWVERVIYALDDPDVAARVPFGVIDHVARARIGDSEGWGMFEHGTFGRHDPSGFADWSSLAP